MGSGFVGRSIGLAHAASVSSLIIATISVRLTSTILQTTALTASCVRADYATHSQSGPSQCRKAHSIQRVHSGVPWHRGLVNEAQHEDGRKNSFQYGNLGEFFGRFRGLESAMAAHSRMFSVVRLEWLTGLMKIWPLRSRSWYTHGTRRSSNSKEALCPRLARLE